MRLACLLAAALTAPLTASAQIQPGQTVPVRDVAVLREDDVLDSVRKHYPPLAAALEERSIADADYLAAQGRFDLVMRARTDTDSLGYYTNRYFDGGFEQPTTVQGLSFLGGYRVSSGEFAPYDGKLDTRSGGEFRTGIRMPLFRDRSVDGRRADLQRAGIGRSLANASVEQQRLLIYQTAIRRYWDWVAAGRRLGVMRGILDIAERRQKFLEEAVAEGQLPAFEAIDNRRAILQRQAQLVEADRAFQQTAIELSLFYRDAGGRPVIAELQRVPPSFPTAEDLPQARVEADIPVALQKRPEVARLLGQRDQVNVDARLARNQRLPAIDLIAGFTTESGVGPVRRGPQELSAGVVFELPLQNRTATGRLRAAEARSRQIDARVQFLEDQIRAEVLDAASALRMAYQRWRVLSEEVDVSRTVEDAERARFELGEGTLFILNLREQATADAAIREILSQADYQRALAMYQFTTASLLDR